MPADDQKDIIGRLFELYESNSKNFLKVFGIILGIGLFFFLTVIFPYFFNVYEQTQKQNQILNANMSIQKANKAIKNLEIEIQSKSEDRTTITRRIEITNASLTNGTSEVNKLLLEAGQYIPKLNNTNSILRLQSLLNTAEYRRDATLQMAFEFLKAYQNTLSAYSDRNNTLNSELNSAEVDKAASEKTLREATQIKSNLAEELKRLAQQWKEIKSPFGNLPIDFANLVAIFPLSIASGFVICLLCLSQAIHLRGTIHSQYDNSMSIHTVAPIWIDPVNPRQSKPVQFLILLLPFSIFLLSIGMIAYSWQFAPSPPFAAANELSISIYYSLYALCFGLSLYSIFRIRKEFKEYRNASSSRRWNYFLS